MELPYINLMFGRVNQIFLFNSLLLKTYAVLKIPCDWSLDRKITVTIFTSISYTKIEI